LPEVEGPTVTCTDELEPTISDVRPRELYWYALWTKSHSEQLVHDQLSALGFTPLLPKITVWSRRNGQRHVISVPMFSGYLFLRHPAMEKARYIDLYKARGLVRVLGEAWDQLHVIPDREIVAIQKALNARLPITPHPYMREGQRVRILSGPMADVEGLFVRSKPNKGLVVLTVDLLRRAVAVEVDCTLVAPV
jgi:transcriptional antiterminator NusG